MDWLDFIRKFPVYVQQQQELHQAVKANHTLDKLGGGLEHVVNAITKADFTATHIATLVMNFESLEKGVEALASHLIEQNKTIDILTSKLDQAIALMPGQPVPEPIVQEPDPAVIEARAHTLAAEYAKPLAAQMLRDRLAGLLDVEKVAA